MSWTPDEDALQLAAEKACLQGLVAGAVMYGINVALCCICSHFLLRRGKYTDHKRQLPLLIYVIVSFILATIIMSSLAAFAQLAFIDDRNYPGGPTSFEANMYRTATAQYGYIAFALSNWFSDSLLVWRCVVIYQDCRFPLWATVALPCLLLVGSLATGVVCLIQISSTFPQTDVNLTSLYLGLSITLNIVVTTLIVLRLLAFRYQIAFVLGPAYATEYTHIVTMVTESAALFTVFTITYLILLALKSPLTQAFMECGSQVQITATLLILFRVAQGKGWTRETTSRILDPRRCSSDLATLQFAFRHEEAQVDSPD
ncbi:hypothetical protein PAXINDRAFT_132561 [Paxillus involutus ATCC 200175]|nr:hypothetical protein PAXINDRAFT_132561 [Paxillus involutus ATCC 200175]